MSFGPDELTTQWEIPYLLFECLAGVFHDICPFGPCLATTESLPHQFSPACLVSVCSEFYGHSLCGPYDRAPTAVHFPWYLKPAKFNTHLIIKNQSQIFSKLDSNVPYGI